MENCGRFGWRAGIHQADAWCYTATDGPHFSQTDEVSIIKGWHGRKYQFNTAFVDGHVRMVKMDGYIWPPPQTPYDPDGDPILTPCHVIRGHGWQLDTLPSAPIFRKAPCGFSKWPANTLQ